MSDQKPTIEANRIEPEGMVAERNKLIDALREENDRLRSLLADVLPFLNRMAEALHFADQQIADPHTKAIIDDLLRGDDTVGRVYEEVRRSK